jgi:succinate-semialdehyde dehydrogenase/glutarate-semialdehyde dehydrogenase
MHMAIATIDPATGETLRTFDALSAQELEAKTQRAFDAFHSHRRTSFADRAARMLRAAEILEADKELLARLMTIEMGKPIKSAGDEVMKCAWACRYYAETAELTLADQTVVTDATHSFVRFSRWVWCWQ